MIGTLWLAAILSALAINDATVLLMTPVLIQGVRDAEVDATGPLVAVILGANIGSVTTALGNRQNTYILRAHNAQFRECARPNRRRLSRRHGGDARSTAQRYAN